jgi:hypothetical protein
MYRPKWVLSAGTKHQTHLVIVIQVKIYTILNIKKIFTPGEIRDNFVIE